MRKKTIISIFILFSISVIFCLRFFNNTAPILKTAITKKDIIKMKYILCKRIKTTGFDWVVIQDKEGNKVDEVCNIIGSDPFEELNLSYDFFMGDNTFIFYIEDRREYYSKELKQNCVEYHATGWDILYPIKHGRITGILESRWYITQNDTYEENENTKEKE